MFMPIASAFWIWKQEFKANYLDSVDGSRPAWTIHSISKETQKQGQGGGSADNSAYCTNIGT